MPPTTRPRTAPTVVPTKGVVREMQATDRSMIDLTLREGFTSMVFLPEGEGIIAVAGGGGRTKEGETLWPIDWSEGQPVLSVRPAIAGIETNLRLLEIPADHGLALVSVVVAWKDVSHHRCDRPRVISEAIAGADGKILKG